MFTELEKLENLFIKIYGQKLSSLIPDSECEEYSGFNFQIGKLNFKFRKSKITPKKVGQFVTLWKRNSQNQTEPYDENDDFDFYVFAAAQEENFGFFIIPKSILVERNILSTQSKYGKRGFRLYPTWTNTDNKLAAKMQACQTQYFVDFTLDEMECIEMMRTILK